MALESEAQSTDYKLELISRINDEILETLQEDPVWKNLSEEPEGVKKRLNELWKEFKKSRDKLEFWHDRYIDLIRRSDRSEK